MTATRENLLRGRRDTLLLMIFVLTPIFSGCDVLEAFLNPEEPASISIYPTMGTLVLGRDDSIAVTTIIFWPVNSRGIYGGSVITGLCVPLYLDGFVEAFNVAGERTTCGGYIGPGPTTGSTVRTTKIKLVPSAPISPPAGIHRVTVDEKPFELTIVDSGSFQMVVQPSFDRQTQGTTESRIVRLVRAPGFTTSVNLRLNSPTQGITSTFSPSLVTGDTSLMRLTVHDSVSVGTKILRVIGTAGNVTDTTSFAVDVLSASYVVTLFPRSMTLRPGQIGTTNVSVASQYLPAALSGVTIPPPYVATTFSPNPTSTTSTMTVAAGPQTQPGIYEIAIVGTFSNGHTGRDTLTLNITPSTNGWTQVLQASSLNGMDVDDLTQTGLAVGFGNTYRSTNGGRSWIMGAPIDTLYTYNSVSLKGSRAVAVGIAGAAALSTNGGVTWTSVLTGTSRILYGASFSDLANGVAVGEGVILRTTNGGSNWSVVPVIGDPYIFVDVSFKFGSAFAVGLDGVVFRSTNYQDNWTQLPTGTTNYFVGVSFVDANNGMVVGSGGIVLLTSDGGSSWVERSISQVSRLDRVYMLSPTVATVGGFNGVIYQTFNAGQTWTRDMTTLSFERVWDIHLAQDNKGVCLVLNNQQTAVTILWRE